MNAETIEAPRGVRQTEIPGREAVLIVDDSPVDRRLIAGLIAKIPGLAIDRRRIAGLVATSPGLVVAYAGDGAEALEVIARDRPAVILTDMKMPVMDGLALVREVRERYPEIPVILMTAHGSEQVAIEALRAGATGYVPKRSIAVDLAPTLKQVLSVAAASRGRARLLGAMKSYSACFELENDPRLIAPLVELLQDGFAAMGLCDATATMRVGVALQEALANAMYHGNLGVSSDLRQDDERIFYEEAERRRHLEPYRSRVIHVEARLDRTEAKYVVRDEGPGFDPSFMDRPIEAEDLMRVGGRGLLLIRTFMDELEFNPPGNQITLIKRGSIRQPVAAAP